VTRAATISDLESLLRLERASPTAAHWTEERYRQALEPSAGAERLVLVAEEGNAGTAALLLGFLVAHHVGGEWELENIAIERSAQRHGLGRNLLDSLLTRARESNSRTVFLEVRESNSAARRLYERAGFELAGRRKAYYANPVEDAVLYRYVIV
jgi:[ribosomal protein S18]-alanine N-acetyltransferase